LLMLGELVPLRHQPGSFLRPCNVNCDEPFVFLQHCQHVE
jgi:hypothetical protein